VVELERLCEYFDAIIGYCGIVESQGLHSLVHSLGRIQNYSLLVYLHVRLILVHFFNYLHVELNALTKLHDPLINHPGRDSEGSQGLEIGIDKLLYHICDD